MSRLLTSKTILDKEKPSYLPVRNAKFSCKKKKKENKKNSCWLFQETKAYKLHSHFHLLLQTTRMHVGYFPSHPDMPAATQAAIPLRGHVRAFGYNRKTFFVRPSRNADQGISTNATFGELPFEKFTTFFGTPEVYKQIPTNNYRLRSEITQLRFDIKTLSKEDAVLVDAKSIIVLIRNRRLQVHIRPHADESEGEEVIRVPKWVKVFNGEWHTVEVSA